jgi:hypothetical protein
MTKLITQLFQTDGQTDEANIGFTQILGKRLKMTDAKLYVYQQTSTHLW